MLPIADLHDLRSGDVLIHPTRGGAIVDECGDDHVWLELTERLDRSETRLRADELQDGWRLAIPGGLFELSVIHPDEASTRVADHPGEALEMLTEELDGPVDRELAMTWLVSRGLLAPGRTISWWAEALDAAASRSLFTVDQGEISNRRVGRQAAQDDAAVDDAAVDDAAEDNAAVDLATLRGQGRRRRFDLLMGLDSQQRTGLLAQALDTGDTATAALLVRWGEAITPDLHAGLDRLVSSGHRPLAIRLSSADPSLVAAALLADARANHNEGLCGEVLNALPPRRRVHLLMEMLRLSLSDTDSLDAAESLIDEYGGLAALQDRIRGTHSDSVHSDSVHSDSMHSDSGADTDALIPAPSDGRWDDALALLRGRSSDTTMEMPSLHPTPLLRDSGAVSGRDAFPVSLALAKALARRHAQGRCGGIRGARLHRAEWRVDLAAPEMGSPAADVRDAVRMVLDLLVGRLAGDDPVEDRTLLAHLASLAPDTPPDWVSVAVQALDPEPTERIVDGLALWEALARAAATARVRIDAPTRHGSLVELGYDTHIGAVKARLGQTNQDAVFFHQHGPVALLLVCDGISISSAGSGNLASALVVQAVASRWEEEAELLADADEPRLHQFLCEALAEGNRSVCDTALRLAKGDLSRHIPMGTTAVGALLRGGRVHLANLGDSRAYLVGASGMAQLTGDGNLMGDWLRSRQGGQHFDMEAEGAALTTYVGHFDLQDRPDALRPQLRSFNILPGEHLLLCSDGLTDFATSSPAELARMVEQALDEHRTLDQACRSLVAQANSGGGGDNISVILARTRP